MSNEAELLRPRHANLRDQGRIFGLETSLTSLEIISPDLAVECHHYSRR